MGFSSVNDLVNQITTDGKSWRQDWNRIVPTVQTAGRFYDLFLAGGDNGQGYHGNHVRNWGFDSVASWDGFSAGGWAWNVAGTAVHTAGTAGNLTQTSGIPIQASSTYTVIVTTSSPAGSGGIQIAVGGTASAAITTATTTIVTVTTGASPTQLIEVIANSLQTMTVDNLIIIAGALDGNSPRFVPYNDLNIQGSLWHGGITGGTATKHLINMGAKTSGGTTVPCTLYLVDLLGCYARVNANTANAITLGNQLTLPRYTTGAGVRAYSVTAPTTLGASAHNFIASYTNQAGVAGRSFPQTVAGTVSAVNSHISHSGTAANNIAPYLPLQSGDAGIRSMQTWQQTVAGGTANTFNNIVLCKPIISIPLTTQFLLSERELLNQYPSLPLIQEQAATTGACLSWLMYAGAATPATTVVDGHITSVWGG
jgi:hypothetical protein